MAVLLFPYLTLWCVGFALLTFAGGCFVYAPYGGRHRKAPFTAAGFGPTIDNTYGWLLLELPGAIFCHFYLRDLALVTGDASDAYGGQGAGWSVTGSVVGVFDGSPPSGQQVALWLAFFAHYLWRSLGMTVARLVLFARARPPVRAEARFPVVLWLLGWPYVAAIAMSLAHAIANLDGGNGTGVADGGRFAVGIVLWFLFFALNVATDFALIGLKAANGGGHVDTRCPDVDSWFLRLGVVRLLTGAIAAPNYLFEILEWLAWGLAASSMAGVWYAVGTFLILAPRAAWQARWHHENVAEAGAGYVSQPGLVRSVWHAADAAAAAAAAAGKGGAKNEKARRATGPPRAVSAV